MAILASVQKYHFNLCLCLHLVCAPVYVSKGLLLSGKVTVDTGLEPALIQYDLILTCWHWKRPQYLQIRLQSQVSEVKISTCLFKKLYFSVYAVTVVPFFSFVSFYPASSYSFRQSPHHCPCPCVIYMCSLATLFSMLYFTCPWLFCNYLFVLLNPLTSSVHTFPLTPSGDRNLSFTTSLQLSCHQFSLRG